MPAVIGLIGKFNVSRLRNVSTKVANFHKDIWLLSQENLGTENGFKCSSGSGGFQRECFHFMNRTYEKWNLLRK